MKIREKIWIVENRIVKTRRNFWVKIEEIAKERQLKIETKHIIWSKENEDKLIKWNNQQLKEKNEK